MKAFLPKKLQWILKDPFSSQLYQCEPLLGHRYYIRTENNKYWYAYWDNKTGWLAGTQVNTEEEAKELAQEHFNNIFLSMGEEVDIVESAVVAVVVSKKVWTETIDALRSLRDAQNGPPLLGRHEEEWQNAMKKAEIVLKLIEE